MTFLVTGGAGFIGSNLVEALLRRGDSVRVLDDFSTGRRQNLLDVEHWSGQAGGKFELIEGDMRDLEVCRQATRGVEFVLHQAAVGSVPRSVADPVMTNAVNVTGTLNVLTAARDAGVSRFVYASSSSLYGESETLPKVETMPVDPISPYGIQKLAGETYCRLFWKLYEFPTVALRYFNVFGRRQDPTSQYSAVVPLFVTAIRENRPPKIFGDGEQTRDFTYIDNAVSANLLACSAGEEAFGEAFNIAGGERISLNRVVQILSETAGRAVEPQYVADRPGDIRHSLADVRKAGRLLGYDPSVDVYTGMQHVWEIL